MPVCVILVRQFIHLTNHFFSATLFNHGLSESFITDEPIVNIQEFFLLAFLLGRIRDEVLVIPKLLPVAVPVGSPFLDVTIGNRKEFKNELEVSLVLFRSISQEVPTRVADDADVPVRQTCFALCFSTSSSSHNSIECSMLMKITLKCLSLRVVLDRLNHISNVHVMWLFHCRMWQSWNVEVDVLLVDCTVELVVRVEWRNFTMFFRSKLFFHWVCTWTVSLNKLLCSIVTFLNTGVFRQIIKFPWSIWKTQIFMQTFFHRSRGNGTFYLYQQTHLLCYQVSPIDHRLVWVLVGLVGGTFHDELLHKTVEQFYWLPVVQL